MRECYGYTDLPGYAIYRDMQSTHQKKKKGSSPNPNIAYPGRLHIQVDPYIGCASDPLRQAFGRIIRYANCRSLLRKRLLVTAGMEGFQY